MQAPSLRAPTAGELSEIAALSVRASVFETPDDLLELAAEEPWRVAVTGEGDAVVLERWRAHLDWLAMRAVWAVPRRVPALVEALREVGRERGFGTLLSPLVASELAGPYARAGMTPTLRVLMLRRELSAEDAIASAAAPAGVELAEAGVDALDELLVLDGRCFEPVWAYDHPTLERYLTRDRAVVAVEPGTGDVLGYVLANRLGEEGMIGRLAVSPEAQGRGVGAALVTEAVRGLAWAGVPYATLTTQADNHAAQRLYVRLGFRTLRGELVGLTTTTATEGP